MRSTRNSWSITGLDLLFPDPGPLETSTESLEKRIVRTAKIIKRWWDILDGKEIDTWNELPNRRQGVLREMGYQYLALLRNEDEKRADSGISADDLALYEKELDTLRDAYKLYLLAVHRYNVKKGTFLDADDPIVVSDPEAQATLDYLKLDENRWQYHFNTQSSAPTTGEVTGKAEWVNEKVRISCDQAETGHVPQSVWNKLHEFLSPVIYDFYLDSVEAGEAPEVWTWAMNPPSHTEQTSNFRRHCDDYWKCDLERKELKKARRNASKSLDQEAVAQLVWKSRAKFLERFLIPAGNLVRQPLEQRCSERECLLVAGWIIAVSKKYRRQSKALQFEHGDAYEGLFIELPGAVLSAIAGEINLKQATRLHSDVNNKITKELHRKKASLESDMDEEDFDLDEAAYENDDFARDFTNAERELRALVVNAKLSEGEKEIFNLLLQEDYSNIELGQILGKSPTRVAGAKKRAFDKIREAKAVKSRAA